MGAGRARDGRTSVVNVALRVMALIVTVVGGPLVVLAAADAVIRDSHTQARVDCTTCDPLTTLTIPTTVTTAVPVETVPGETVPPGGAQAVTATTSTTIPPEPVATFVGRPRSRQGDAVLFEVASVLAGQWADGDAVGAAGIGFAPWREYHVDVVLPAGETEPVVGRARTRGLVAPAGWGAFGVLPTYDLLALIAAPLLVASVAFLFVDNRRRARVEANGAIIKMVPRRPRRARRRRRATPAGP